MKNKLISNFINLYKEREELYVLLNSREFQKSIKHPELPLYSRIRKEFQEEMKLVRKINKLSEDLIRMYIVVLLVVTAILFCKVDDDDFHEDLKYIIRGSMTGYWWRNKK